MNILLTGGAGFIGSAMIWKLNSTAHSSNTMAPVSSVLTRQLSC